MGAKQPEKKDDEPEDEQKQMLRFLQTLSAREREKIFK